MKSDSCAPRDALVEVVEYRNDWPQLFEAERRLLERALAPWLVGQIEHIGSTAVVGLPAKPVVDIMAPVRSLAESRLAIDAAITQGYVHNPYRNDVMHWFCKPSPGHRTHHLHLVPLGSPLWNARLKFREALRQSRELADEYAALKRMLAASFRNDRDGYTNAKGPFIQRVLAAQGVAK